MLIKSVIQKCKNKHQHDKYSLNKVLLKFDNKFCNAYKTHTYGLLYCNALVICI